jgi:antitoxin MazE
MTTMKTELVRIGNSRGIRIPKPLIEQCRLENTVELSVENNRLVISPGRRLRQGWIEAFQSAGSAVGDELLLEMRPGEFDRKEWTW